jgi:putative ABC transport system permease protein
MKNIILFLFSLRSYIRHPIQTLFTILGIMVGVSLVVSIDSANTNAIESFRASSTALNGTVPYRITSAHIGVHDSVFAFIRMNIPALRCSPVIDSYARIRLLDSRNNWDDGASPQIVSGHILGIDALSYTRLQPTQENSAPTSLQLLSPVVFERFMRGDGIILTYSMSRTLQCRQQDSVQILFDGIAHTTVILAILNDTSLPNDMVLCDIGMAQAIFFHQGLQPLPYVHRLDIIPDSTATLAHIQALLPPGCSIESTQSSSTSFETMTAAFDMNLQALSLLALIVSMFITYNTMSFSVLQRREEFGVMRVLGADRSVIASIILRETVLISSIASLLGCLFGSILAQILTHLVSNTISDLYANITATTHLRWISLLKGCGIGIVTSIIAIVPTLWECYHIEPRYMTQRLPAVIAPKHMVRLFVLGIILCSSAWIALLTINYMATGFVAIILLIIGASCMLPLLIYGMVRFLGTRKYVQRQLWMVFALRGIMLGLQRFSIAIAALMVAVSTVIAVTIMIFSFRDTVNTWLLRTLDSDIYISPPSMVARTASGIVDDRITQEIIALPMVRSYNTFRSRSFTVHTDQTSRIAQLVALRLDSTSYHRYRFAESLPNPWQLWSAPQTVFISEPLAHHAQIAVGDSIRLQTADGMTAWRVGGIIYDYASDVGVVYVSDQTYRNTWKDNTISGLSLKCDSSDVPALIEQCQAIAKQYQQRLLIRSNATLRTTSLEIFDKTFQITDALRLLTLFVACLSIFSTLLAIQMERAHEHAIARALGMSALTIRFNVLFQTAVAGIIAGVCSLPLGYAMAIILTEYINTASFGWSLELHAEFSTIGVTIILAMLMAVLSGIYPAHVSATVNIARALHDE